MKKVFAFSLVLIMMLAVCCAPIGAAEAAGVDIWVNIINGGTAVIITEVNCPLPDKSRITLEDGQSEAFHIDFTEEGTYSYLVEIEPDERELTFDDTVYNVKVLVSEDNGKLYTSILIYNTKSGNKYAPQGGGDDPCTITFSNSTEPPAPTTATEPVSPTDATETPSDATESDEGKSPSDSDGGNHSAQPDQNGGSSSGGSSKPQTGDDSRLDFYLLLAILASAGLFMLSVFYYRSVMKEIKCSDR